MDQPYQGCLTTQTAHTRSELIPVSLCAVRMYVLQLPPVVVHGGSRGTTAPFGAEPPGQFILLVLFIKCNWDFLTLTYYL